MTEQMRTAMNSMTQGLSMFDALERLVVCNAQYYKMYDLTPDDVKPGSTLSEVLAKRAAKGSFSARSAALPARISWSPTNPGAPPSPKSNPRAGACT